MKKKQRPKIIFIAGPPGSGKGTQALLLKEKMGIEIIQVNRIVREKFSQDPFCPEVIKAKKNYDSGRLVDGNLVAKWMTNKIKSLGKKALEKGLILDGSARTLVETKAVIKILDEYIGKDKIKLFFLKIRPKETLARNLKRIICEKCQRPIDPKLIKKITKCPDCGGNLIKRTLDDEKIIKNRLFVYQKETLPAIQYLKKLGLVIEINGEQSIEKVFKDIVFYL